MSFRAPARRHSAEPVSECCAPALPVLRRRPAIKCDEGSVLLLVVGLIPVLFLLLAVGVDASTLFIHRRALSSTADAAALAAAQSADLQRFYRGEATADLPIDCDAARRKVEAMLTPDRLDARAGGAQLESIDCDRTTVSVQLRSRAELPFAHFGGIAPTVDVRGHATARSPLR